MFYREIAPSEDLRHLVLSFWEFAVPDDAPATVAHEIFPDGCVSVFYLRNLQRGLNIVGVTGLQLQTVVRQVAAGDRYWGMRISPAACSAILRINPSQLAGQAATSDHDFSHLTNGLGSELADARDLEAAAAILEDYLRGLSGSIPAVDDSILEAVSIIEQSPEIRVDELAGMLDMSTRQFQRRFKRCSGLSPKQYIRTRRIRATAVVLVENTTVNWASRAAEMGFSDQSHLTHEFVSVTNRSPKAFAKNVKKIDHGELVK